MRRARYVKGKKVGKGNMVNDVSPLCTPCGHPYAVLPLFVHMMSQCAPPPGFVLGPFTRETGVTPQCLGFCPSLGFPCPALWRASR